MRSPQSLEVFDAALARYLATRRALGRSYVADEYSLVLLRSFLLRTGRNDLDREAFEAWRGQFLHLSSATRVAREYAAHRFCRYRRRTDPHFFVPDTASLARLKGRPAPTIFSEDQVAQMLAYVDALPPLPNCVLRAPMRRIAVVLLYTTGMRRGELARLTLGDIDAATGVLRVQDSKFHKSRWLPLSRSAADELRGYLRARRRKGFPQDDRAPLLCNAAGKPMHLGSVSNLIENVLRGAGIRNQAGRVPHAHDFRHSFAVGALLRWYDAGADVQTLLPRLAMYMGHVSIVSTAYYLQHMPLVVERASQRFGASFEHLLGGTS